MQALRAVPWLPVTLVAVLLAACGAPAPHRLRERESQLTHVGPFTVRAANLPAAVVGQAFPRVGAYALSGPDTLLRVSTDKPYVLSTKTLGRSDWRALETLPCVQQPLFAQSRGPEAVLVCAGPVGSRANALDLVTPQGAVQAIPLPVRIPVPLARVVVSTGQIGGTKGQLSWSVALNSEPPVDYGEGTIDLRTGKSVPPQQQVQPVSNDYPYDYSVEMTGEDDTLYEMHFPSGTSSRWADVFRWSLTSARWVPLGRVPYLRDAEGSPVIAGDGSLWLSVPRPTAYLEYFWRVVREVPGSSRITTWYVHGSLLGVGPGFFAYLPYDDPTTMVVNFPLEHRKLIYANLSTFDAPPYRLNEPASLDRGWSQITGAQVLILGTSHGVRELIVSP